MKAFLRKTQYIEGQSITDGMLKTQKYSSSKHGPGIARDREWDRRRHAEADVTKLVCELSKSGTASSNPVRSANESVSLGLICSTRRNSRRVALHSIMRRHQRRPLSRTRGIESIDIATRSYWLLLAETHLTRRLFGGMLRRIATLPSPAG